MPNTATPRRPALTAATMRREVLRVVGEQIPGAVITVTRRTRKQTFPCRDHPGATWSRLVLNIVVNGAPMTAVYLIGTGGSASTLTFTDATL